MPASFLRCLHVTARLATFSLVFTSVIAAASDAPPWRVQGVWRQAHGLPQQTINCLLQTRDGYLWLGTKAGLARFDGVQFTLFDERNPAQIRQNEILALVEDRAGDLWIGTFGGGVSVVRAGHHFTQYTAANALPSDLVTALGLDAEGAVWLGTDRGLSRFQDGRFTHFPPSAAPLPLAEIRVLRPHRERGLWIATNAGHVLRAVDGRFTAAMPPGLPRAVSIHALLEDRGRALWIANDDGLFRFHEGAVRKFTTDDGLASNHVRGLLEDSAGNIWIGTANGLSRFADGQMSVIDVSDRHYARNFIAALGHDHEGNVWVGANGLLRVARAPFRTYTIADGLAYDFIAAMLVTAGDTLWIGHGRGLALRQDGKFFALPPSGGLPQVSPSALALDRENRLWVGTSTALYRASRAVASGEQVAAARFESVLAQNIRGLHVAPDGALWIATNSDGVLRRAADGSLTPFTTREGLPSNVTRAIAADAAGDPWVATTKGVAHWHDGRWSVIGKAEGLLDDSVEGLHVDGRGQLWLATRHGITRYSGGKATHCTIADGLFSNFVSSFVEDTIGNLWMTCSQGVFRIDLREFDEFAAGKRTRIKSVSYGPERGVTSPVSSAPFQGAAQRTSDGRLWFAMAGGLSTVDPRVLLPNNQAPPVHIENVEIDGEDFDPHVHARAEPGRGDLAFRFTALSFLAPGKVRFRYQLAGYDRDWIESGARRAAFYSNIPPGDYRFRVKAANEDDVWNDAGASFAFTLRPHYYQTPWFFAACGLGAIALGLGAHRLRTRRLRAQSEMLGRLVADRTQANDRLRAEVAERQHAEAALRASEERYRRFFEEDLAGAFISTPSGRIVACNPAFARIFGFETPAEAIGLEMQPFYQRASDRDELLARLRRDHRVQDHPLEMKRRDGGLVSVIANVIANPGANGEPLEIKGYVIDVTERSRLEAQLRQAQKMEAIGRLAGGIAHDFNNLLTGIIGYAQLVLAEKNLPRTVTAGLNEIVNAGKLAAVLTRQLLAFSRRQILQPRVLDLNLLIAELKNMLRRLIGEDVELVFALDATEANVRADPGQLEQIVLNLTVNSRDAMPRGGRLTIATQLVEFGAADKLPSPELVPGRYVKLAVADTGSGMTPDVLAHLFEPFFTTKPVGQGTGLGLSTVYGIVRQSRGHISVDSAPGKGTRFEILLPLVDSPAQARAPAAALPSAQRVARILVVEDNELVRTTATILLRRAGHTVTEAANAMDALRRFEDPQFEIDLLLTDVVMPDLNGRDLAAQVLAKRPNLRVIFMSGYTDDAMLRYGLETGRRFVEKPFTAEVLLKKVSEALGE